MLRENPEDRRVVLAMWDTAVDLDNPSSKDLPCNTHIYFRVRPRLGFERIERIRSIAGPGEVSTALFLDMTVCCRSNDMIWGCYGANAVHFSYLLEYVAAMSGYAVGTYTQISNSFHAYTERWGRYTGLPVGEEKAKGQRAVSDPVDMPKGNPQTVLADASYSASEAVMGTLNRCPYRLKQVEPYALVSNPDKFDQELAQWFEETETNSERKPVTNQFLNQVATPMFSAWSLWKMKQPKAALGAVEMVAATDWRKACVEWMQRRIK